MTYKQMLKQLIRDLVGVEKEYRKLKRAVEEFCAVDPVFKAKDIFNMAKAIVDKKFTFDDFCKEFDKQYAKAVKEKNSKLS